MNRMTMLASFSLLAAAALFLALVFFLVRIVKELERIGGARKDVLGTPASFLSKIRLGVRAIEVQTGWLAPQVIQLNAGLTAIRDGLGAIDSNLDGVITNVSAQGTKSDVTPETVQTIWTITLVVFTAVLVVVAILLTLILTTARHIVGRVTCI